MIEIEHKIFVEGDIYYNEFSYYFGDKRDDKCYVSYYNLKRHEETCHVSGNYRVCLSFARYRSNDRRYRNYEFFIHIDR